MNAANWSPSRSAFCAVQRTDLRTTVGRRPLDATSPNAAGVGDANASSALPTASVYGPLAGQFRGRGYGTVTK